MAKMNRIDPIKHFEEISENLNNLHSIIKEGVSPLEMKDLKNDLLKAEFLAYQLKLGLSIDSLQRKTPELSVRDVIVKLTPELRPDISPKLIPVLIQYIMEEWISRKTRKAA